MSMETTTQTLTDFLLARYEEAEWHLRFFGKPAKHCASLADVEAKRRIVHEHAWTGEVWSLAKERDCPRCGGYAPCDTLKALALPYAEHPDWSKEWRA